MNKLIYILVVFVLLCSCNHQNAIKQAIARADSLMDVHQDSARVALSMLDSLKAKKPEMSKAQRMRYELIYAKGMNKGYVDFTTDSVMKEVVAYYDNHGSANEKMLANYLLGCTYRDLKDAPVALECYLQASERADTTSKGCDYQTLAHIYGQIGTLYLRQKMPLNAKEAYWKSEKYSWIAKDTLGALIAAESQVNTLRLLISPQKVIKQFDGIYKNYKKFGYSKEAARSLGILIQSLVQNEQYAKAKQHMNIYEKESGYFGEKMEPGIRYYTYFYTKGLCYLNLHSDSAKIYFQKCSKLAGNVNAKRIAFDGWYKYYKQKHQIDSIEKYADLFIQYSDSVRIQNETEVISQTSALYNYSQWEKKAKLQEVEKNKAHAVNILIIVIMTILISLVVLCVKKERQIRNKQLLFVKQQVAMKELELQKGQEELAEIKKEMSLASVVVLNKEKSIAMLKNEIEALTIGCSLEECKSKDVFLQKAIVIKFKQLAENGIEPSSQQWRALKDIFDAFFKQFKQTLEVSYKLSENEYKVSMLVWLGFSPSQMKVLMKMSSSNISNIRKRLSKKLFDKEMTTSKFDQEIRKIQLQLSQSIRLYISLLGSSWFLFL